MSSAIDAAKTVTALEAAERYIGGALRPKRQGKYMMCRCLWHNDKTPSLAFKENGTFECFGCHKWGTSIDVAMKVFDIEQPYDAAVRICSDFRVQYDPGAGPSPKKIAERIKRDLREELNTFYVEVCNWFRFWDDFILDRAEHERGNEDFSDSFAKALEERETIGALIDDLDKYFKTDNMRAAKEKMDAYRDQRPKWKKCIENYRDMKEKLRTEHEAR